MKNRNPKEGFFENLGRTALTKVWVSFTDKSRPNITRYSYDKRCKNSLPDINLGIKRLEEMIFNSANYKGQWEVAIIYENKPGGKMLAKYRNGMKVI